MPNKKCKVLVRFEIDILSIENIPDTISSDGFILHWKRSGSSSSKGSSHPVLVQCPITSFDPLKEHTKFIFTCRFFRDAKTAIFTPTKSFKLAVQLESVTKKKKQYFGKCNIELNHFAEDGTFETIRRPLSKTVSNCIPNVRLSIKADWESLDGHALNIAAPSLTEDVKVRNHHKKQNLSTFLRRSVSIFPTSKVTINGKVYELYEQADDPPDASMSYLSERNRSDTEIEFTCDEFDSDDEEENENEFDKKSISKKERLKKVESAKIMIKKKTGLQSKGNSIPVVFKINILSVTGLNPSVEGNSIFISWRRGAKKNNTGRTKKAKYEDGEAIWDDNSDGHITIHATMIKDLKTLGFEEKNISLSLKKIVKRNESSKSVLLGQLVLDLSKYAIDNNDITSKFKLIERTSKSLKTSKSDGHVDADIPIKKKPKSSNTIPKIEINITCEYENLEKDEKMETEEDDDEQIIVDLDPPKSLNFGAKLLRQLIVDGTRIYTVPPTLTMLIKGIEQNGLTRQGIFRLSGRSGQVAELIDLLNDDPHKVDLSLHGPHELADCLKKYLRALPNSLLPDDYYDECLEIGDKYKIIYDKVYSDEEINELNVKLSEFLYKLPPENSAALRVLCELLYKIQENAIENKMHIENISTVFAPTVIQKEILDPARFLTDNSKKICFMKAIIEFSPNWIANEDFTTIDDELKKKEQNLNPEQKIKRIESHLTRSNEQVIELQQTLTLKNDIISQYELMEFILRTNQKWNESNNKYQAAIDIYNHSKSSNAFNPFNSSFLYAIIKALQILHRRSIDDISGNCFWLSVCVNLLDLWENDDNLLFIGDIKEKGILSSSETLGQVEYRSLGIDTWKPSKDEIQSCSHFEQQFRIFILQVFYSLCRSFAEQCGDFIISLGLKEASWSSKSVNDNSSASLLSKAVYFINTIEEKHISNVITVQILHCMWREVSTYYLQELGNTKDLCTTEAGLKVKMNLTTLLHSVRENPILSQKYSLIENELQPILIVANFLVTMSNFSAEVYPDVKSITSIFPKLEYKTIFTILDNYTDPSITDNEEFEKHKKILLSDIELNL